MWRCRCRVRCFELNEFNDQDVADEDEDVAYEDAVDEDVDVVDEDAVECE